MISCFLSHSSKDKAQYVQLVADRLPKQWRVYDSDTFESGMKTLDEILRTLGETSLFVLFLSDSSLNSEWVRGEIKEARRLELSGSIRRIYPIIIDRSVSHNDPRIPDWMRESYNLHVVTRPTHAARRIQQRLRELSWQIHPRLKERQKIFVGRNDRIKEIEERFDDYDRSPPTCLICAGLQVMGRKTLMRHGLVKAAKVSESYESPQIVLTPQESVEDFILKMFDLGMFENVDVSGLMQKTLETKIEIAAELCRELSRLDEILIIEDTGAIITYQRDLAPWFEKMLDLLRPTARTMLAIASRFRADFHAVRRDDIYYTTLSELSTAERMGLFKRIAEFEKINLSSDDYAYFRDLLYGFPEQVFYAVTLIKELGLPQAKKKTELLIDFNSDRAARLVNLYANTQPELEFLYLLSEFDFISYELLESLTENKDHETILEKFLAGSLCENLGANGEYVRLNDAIRDYVRRSGMRLPEQFSAKMRTHVSDFLKTQNQEEVDASDYLFSLKRALIENREISPRLLIPSHFVKAMKELYDKHRNYKEVVRLADRALNSSNYLDENIAREIRYFLCLSLARERDERFLREVQQVRGPEHDFLLGFYYRMCHRTGDAIDRQLRAVKETRTASRARRELVQLYVTIEEFATALSLAKQNYEDSPSNPFHIQAYLKCLINSKDWRSHQKLIERLLDGLSQAATTFEKAEEMQLTARAQYEAFCKGDFAAAHNTIDDASKKFPENPYPMLTKISIMFREGANPDEIRPLVQAVSRHVHGNGLLSDAITKMKAQLHWVEGNHSDFDKVTKSILKNVPAELQSSLLDRIRHLKADVGVAQDGGE